MMLSRIAQHWPVVSIVAMLAYIVYAFVVPPPWAERKSAKPWPQAVPLSQTFSTAGDPNFRDLTISFSYPADWTLKNSPGDGYNVRAILLPKNQQVWAPLTCGMSLTVSVSHAEIREPMPYVPVDGKLIRHDSAPAGSTTVHVVEFTRPAYDDTYRRCLAMQTRDQRRRVEMTATAQGGIGSGEEVERLFEAQRPVFEAVLASLRFEPTSAGK